MEVFYSKYTGEEVEALLDKINAMESEAHAAKVYKFFIMAEAGDLPQVICDKTPNEIIAETLNNRPPYITPSQGDGLDMDLTFAQITISDGAMEEIGVSYGVFTTPISTDGMHVKINVLVPTTLSGREYKMLKIYSSGGSSWEVEVENNN